MTHYYDLTKFEYHNNNYDEDALNVGWLDVEGCYTKGPVPDEFIEKLWYYLQYKIVQMRGYHECNLCKMKTGYLSVKKGRKTYHLGSAQIRVIGIDGKIYAAPNLIYHYIIEHQYKPPDEFINAVLLGPRPDSKEYLLYLKKYFSNDFSRMLPKRAFRWFKF